MAKRTMLEQFERARVVSVPLMEIRTADQAATVATVQAARGYGDIPLVQWDAATGMHSVNKAGELALSGAQARNPVTGRMEPAPITAKATVDFVKAMVEAQRLPETTVLFVHNAHRQLVSADPYVTAGSVQAVANLRDEFKKNFRMAVLLTSGMQTPPELQHDVVRLDHELPGAAELATIVTELYAASQLPAPKQDALNKIVEACSGVSTFAAETNVSLALTQSGVDMDTLLELHRRTIESTRGLSVHRGPETFADIRGLENVKRRLTRIRKGKLPIGVVVFMDEFDKSMANVEQDTSGVRMDQLKSLLTRMEDRRWHGIVLKGVPGGGKSLVGKAFGNECGVPTIMMDLGGLEDSLVGNSEQNIRRALDVIEAVGGGHAFFIAATNDASPMRPEMQRRFTKGTFFVDLLTAEERDAAWKLHLLKLGLPATMKRPNDDGWTGAEIRNCCEEAWNTDTTLIEAAEYVLPVALARAEEIDAMRRAAHGRYLDASKAGQYSYIERSKDKVLERSLRAINLPAN